MIRCPTGSLGVALAAVTTLVAPSEAAEARRVMAGRPSYDTSAFHNLFMGSGYRKEWVTPIDFPVLDLATFARRAHACPAGRLDAEPRARARRKGRKELHVPDLRTRTRPRSCRPSGGSRRPARSSRTRLTASHPGAALIVPAPAEAASVPHTNPVAVFMPDDPALGEFRATFGGKPGLIDEYALPASAGHAGFHGAAELISTKKLWERWLAGEAVVDTRALLRARIFDLFLGDWDRHNGQWRWMHCPMELRPLVVRCPRTAIRPSRFGGVIMPMARRMMPRFSSGTTTTATMMAPLLRAGRSTSGCSRVERQAFEVGRVGGASPADRRRYRGGGAPDAVGVVSAGRGRTRRGPGEAAC